MALVDGGDAAVGERAVERAFAIDDGVVAALRSEAAEDGVGELAVDLDELLAGDGVALAAGVAEEAAEEVGEELRLFVGVGAAGGEVPGYRVQGQKSGVSGTAG